MPDLAAAAAATGGMDPSSVAQAAKSLYATQYAYSLASEAANGAQQLAQQAGYDGPSEATDGTPTTYMTDAGGNADATSNFDKVRSVAKFFYDKDFPSAQAFAKVCRQYYHYVMVEPGQ